MTDWDQALCRSGEVHPDVFFDETFPEQAMKICQRCPVLGDCQDYTHDLEQRIGRLEGVWGSMTKEDRKELWPLDTYAVQRVRAGIY